MTKRKSDAEKASNAALRRAREGRQAASSYARTLKHRERIKKALKHTVTQEERVDWALARLRSARGHLSRDKHDRVWQLAVKARQAEYDRERDVLARLTQQQRAG
jgi:hypothetical protein